MKPRLTGQAAIIGIGRVLNMVAASATLMVLARVLPDKESYGAICQLLLLYMALSQIFAVGLPQSIYYFLPRCTREERSGFLTQTVLLLALAGGVLGAGFYLGADLLARLLHNPQLAELLAIFAWYPLCMLPTLAVESAMLHADRPYASVIFNALSRAAMFCSLVLPVLAGASLARTVQVWVGAALLTGLIGLVLIFSIVRGEPFHWQPRMLREEGKFSLPLAVSSLLAIAGIYLDRFVISHNYGPAVLGSYHNASIILPTLGMVVNSGAVVLMAELSRRSSSGEYGSFMPIWNNAMMKSGTLLLAAFGFLVFWHDETMRLLFSQRFADSGDIFAIYVWMIPAQLFIVQSLFVALGATRWMLLVSLVNLFIEVACILAGTFFGVFGIAAGAVAARYLGVGYAAHCFIHRMPMGGWRGFMPWLKLGVIMGLALLAGAVTHFFVMPALRGLPFPLLYACGVLVYLLLYLIGLRQVRLLHFLLPVRYLPARWYPRQEVAP